MPLKRAFGKALQLLRQQQGLSTRGLAALVDVPESRVLEWETGHAAPTPTELTALDILFHPPQGALTVAAPDPAPTAPHQDPPPEQANA